MWDQWTLLNNFVIKVVIFITATLLTRAVSVRRIYQTLIHAVHISTELSTVCSNSLTSRTEKRFIVRYCNISNTIKKFRHRHGRPQRRTGWRSCPGTSNSIQFRHPSCLATDRKSTPAHPWSPLDLILRTPMDIAQWRNCFPYKWLNNNKRGSVAMQIRQLILLAQSVRKWEL